MNRLLLFMLLTSIVLATESYINQDKKGKPDIRMIELVDNNSNKESNEILHVPDRQRRAVYSQERNDLCTKDEDCGLEAVCFARLICVMGTWRTLNSLETNTAN
ncbi:uncharacterized protein [Linepithema humile]|uniref:uncharacterized protein n=1 Tax=Linepithema humile TaxID=83485 RepID=UPI00351E4A65